MKAAAPMTGGINVPAAEAAASTPPAKVAGKPSFFMAGIVNAPVVITLAMELPLILAKKPLAIMATLALPPLVFATRDKAISLKNLPAPIFCKAMAKTI